jgi:hypothetical protein
MREGPPPIVNQKQEHESRLTETLQGVISKLQWKNYFKEDAPLITKALAESGFDIEKINERCKQLLGENTVSPNAEEITPLKRFFMNILYAIPTYYRLENNKKGIIYDEDPDIIDPKLRASPKTPLYKRKGLHDNVRVNLWNLIEKNHPEIDDELQRRVIKSVEHMRAKNKILREMLRNQQEIPVVPKDEQIAEERAELEEKLYFEKSYIDLILANKIPSE